MIRRLVLGTALFVLALTAGSLPLLAIPPAGQAVDGIRCDQMESNVFHIHAHLSITKGGKPVSIPDDVGRSLLKSCLYWLHTHTADGLIHIESPQARSFTLGQFFDIWGEALTRFHVASAHTLRGEKAHIWVDGEQFSGDPRTIELHQHSDIVIQLSPPFKRPPAFTQWNGN